MMVGSSLGELSHAHVEPSVSRQSIATLPASRTCESDSRIHRAASRGSTPDGASSAGKTCEAVWPTKRTRLMTLPRAPRSR